MQEIKLNVEQENGVIGFNFEEIKGRIQKEVAPYKTMVFTEDSSVDAKKTVAWLRKFKKAMDDKRKEVKISYMQPYADFEQKVKELYGLIEEPIEFINGQVEEFERRRVKEKKQLIETVYNENVAEMKEYLPLQKIYNSKWENASTSRKSIVEEITVRVEGTRKDIDTIRSMESEFEDKGLAAYKRTLALADAIQTIHNYEKQKEEILARQKAQEERATVPAPVPASAINTPTPAPEQEPMAEIVKTDTNTSTNDTDITTYEVIADAFQLAQLESAMREFGIQYRRKDMGK